MQPAPRLSSLAKLIRITLPLLMLASAVSPTYAQSDQGLGNWIGVTSKLRFSDRWSLFLFRLEQRWITTEVYGTEYSNRGRYKLGLTFPLGGGSVTPGTNFIKAFNEVFIDFDLGDYWFDLESGKVGLNQNRLFVGFGRQLTALSSFQIGLMWQHRPKVDYLRLILSYSPNFDFRQGE